MTDTNAVNKVGNEHRPYDEKGNPTCSKCGGDMEGKHDERTCCNYSACQLCGNEIVHGFGIIYQ